MFNRQHTKHNLTDLHIVIKLQFFTFIFAAFLLNLLHTYSFSCWPFRENFCTRLQYFVFIISTFQLQYFPRYQGVPNLHQGPCAPWRPLAEKKLTHAQVLAYIYVTVNFQLRSSINAGLTERSLYNKVYCHNESIQYTKGRHKNEKNEKRN